MPLVGARSFDQSRSGRGRVAGIRRVAVVPVDDRRVHHVSIQDIVVGECIHNRFFLSKGRSSDEKERFPVWRAGTLPLFTEQKE